MTDGPPCRIVLVGMMGSGKTSVGGALSRRTGWPFHDNDRLVHDATGRSAREIATDGEPALRSAESAALRLALARPEPAIVAVAAGAILDPVDRRELAAKGLVVWLRADPAILAERARSGVHRPWLDEDPEGWMRIAAAAREPLYRDVATQIVDTAVNDPERAADEVLAALAGGPCGAWLDP
jgi:shikimate kinase